MRIAVALFCLFMLFSCSQRDAVVQAEDHPVSEPDQAGTFQMPKLPEYVTFCGDTLFLDDFDKRERLDKELIVNTFYHSSTIQAFKRAHRHFPQLEEVLGNNGIPMDMKYLCLIESNLTQAVSPSGAKGFWQFMPETGRDFGLRIDREVDERLHVDKSTKAAGLYLHEAYDEFNDWFLAAASYNAGIGAIRDALVEQEADDFFDLYLNEETSRYVFRILALKLIFENPEAYGFEPATMELYQHIKVKKVAVKESVKNLVVWSKEHGTTFRKLKILNPWILGESLTVAHDTLYIDLPE